MIREIRGRVLCLGDNVDTDQIYSSRYIELTDDAEMAKHALEGLDPDLPGKLSEYSILVAGRNLGCGSSREHAPRSLRAAGIRVLIAESFARIFYRNAINLGLPAIHLPSTKEISSGSSLIVRLVEGIVIDETNDTQHSFRGFNGLVRNILEAGGLVEYYRHRPDALKEH
jgi:3-isopropylmalate/(R)-2-methylmalate dehydratase small subunit